MSRKLYHNCVLHRPGVVEPPQEHGWILVEQGRIKRLGRGPLPGAEETVDLGGHRVLPGLVNAHTHLYSSLAGRMPWPEKRPMPIPTTRAAAMPTPQRTQGDRTAR